MKKLIVFSLWGNNPKYTIGAIRNAELAPIIYPDWICRFYVGKSTPQEIIEKLKSFNHTEVIEMDEGGDWTGMFWRFYPASEEDIDVMISRDTDSRLNIREKLAVDEWLNSGKGLHIMRDHPYHNTKILGGMWGMKKGTFPQMKSEIEKYRKGDFIQVDQNFLSQIVYPICKNNSFVHDEFFSFETHRKNFPSERIDKQFVGDVFDFEDNRHPNYYKIIK
jgi:hypothetical protein